MGFDAVAETGAVSADRRMVACAFQPQQEFQLFGCDWLDATRAGEDG